jgi:glycosyltransferase 2 family protein
VKKILQVVLGIIISLVFLWLAFRNSDLGKVFGLIKNADIGLLVIAFLISIFTLMIRSYRWKLLGKQYKDVPWNFFFKATSMGLMLNIFLPFRTGDLFQGYFLSKNSGISKSYTLATVFLERLIDMIPPSIMILVGSFFIVLPSQVSLKRLFALLSAAVICIFLVIKFHGKLLGIFAGFIKETHSQKLKGFFENIVHAFVFLKDRQVLTRALPLTFCVWIMYTFCTFLILRAVGIELNFWSTFVIQAIGVLSVAIPSSPGFVGTWEFFCLLALGIFSVGQDRALSYALVSHFMAFLPTTITGVLFFYKDFFLKGNKVNSVLKPQ